MRPQNQNLSAEKDAALKARQYRDGRAAYQRGCKYNVNSAEAWKAGWSAARREAQRECRK